MRNSLLIAIAATVAACSQQDSDENNVAAAPTDVDVLPPDESVDTPTDELATGVAAPAGDPGANTQVGNSGRE